MDPSGLVRVHANRRRQDKRHPWPCLPGTRRSASISPRSAPQAQRWAFLHRTAPRGKRRPSAHSTVARARQVARSPTSGHPGMGSGYWTGKAIRSSRPAGIGGPPSSHKARMPGWTSRWGRGSPGHGPEDQETFEPWLSVCAFRPRLRASARARTAHSRVVPSRHPRGRHSGDRIGTEASRDATSPRRLHGCRSDQLPASGEMRGGRHPPCRDCIPVGACTRIKRARRGSLCPEAAAWLPSRVRLVAPFLGRGAALRISPGATRSG